MFRFLAVAAMSVTLSLAGPAFADDRLAKLLSEDFARKAIEALSTGDRREAIVLALSGLPASATEDDLTTFEPAYNALLLAAVARSTRLPVEGIPHAAFDPTGNRVATGQMVPRMDKAEVPGVQLWDVASGELVADLISDKGYRSNAFGSGAPAFSSDGRFLAVPEMMTGIIHVFDGQTGAPITQLKSHSGGQLAWFQPPVFNADSSLMLTIGGKQSGIRVWNTNNWSLIAKSTDESCSYEAPVMGRKDASVRYLTIPLKGCGSSVITLTSVGSDGALKLEAEIKVEDTNLYSSPGLPSIDRSGKFLLLRTSTFDNTVYDMAGSVVAKIPSSVTGYVDLKFAMGADALVQGSDTFGTSNVRMYDFEGKELAVPIEEHLPLLHHVFTASGNPIGYGLAFHGTYIGADLPRGAELVAMLEAGLSSADQERLLNERVAP